MVANPGAADCIWKPVINIQYNQDVYLFSVKALDETTVEYKLGDGISREHDLPENSFFTVEIQRYRIRESNDVWMEVRVNGISLLQRQRGTDEIVKDITVYGQVCKIKFKNFLVKRFN